MTELCEVVITAPDPAWLKHFSRTLVERGLCSSAHNFASIRSVYRWRGDIIEREEGRVGQETHAAASNIGVAKGSTYDRVLIFPTKPMLEYLKTNDLTKLPSRHRLYVAVTRARFSVTFVLP